jgi:hypothetical protein
MTYSSGITGTNIQPSRLAQATNARIPYGSFSFKPTNGSNRGELTIKGFTIKNVTKLRPFVTNNGREYFTYAFVDSGKRKLRISADEKGGTFIYNELNEENQGRDVDGSSFVRKFEYLRSIVKEYGNRGALILEGTSTLYSIDRNGTASYAGEVVQ